MGSSNFSFRMSSFSLVLCAIYAGLETKILSVIHHNSGIFCMAHKKLYIDVFGSFVGGKLAQLGFKGRN